jgi:hypothetical protein
VGGQELNVSTVNLDLARVLLVHVLLTTERGEAPVLGDDDLLATRELVLRAAESLEGDSSVGITSADTQDDLANVDTGNGTVGLTPGTTHTSLQSIGTCARQHLVDTDDVVRVGADTHVERVLSSGLDEVPDCSGQYVFLQSQYTVSKRYRLRSNDIETGYNWNGVRYSLVGANTGGLKSLRAQLFVLVGDQVDAERELIDTSTLAAKVEDADLRVGDTTVETRLGVRLEIC